MLLILAWRNIWRNTTRTLITMAMIVVAVLLTILMRSLQEGSYEKMIENVVSFYSGYIQIHKDGYWDDQIIDNSFEQTPVIKTSAGSNQRVSQVVPRLESFALASTGENTKGCLVVGIDPESEDLLTNLKNKLIKGQYLHFGEAGSLVAEELARKLQLEVGDTIVLIGQGYHGIQANGKYEVSGIVRFGSPELNQRMVYLPLPTAQELYGAEGRLTSLALSIHDPDASGSVTRELRSGLSGEYEVMEWKEMMPELVQTIEADRGGGILMMGVLYLIISFGIFGTILMMTKERKYEFGVLVAVGMKKLKLAWVVIVETLMVAALGAIAGIIISLPIVLYFQQNPIYLGDELSEAYAQFGMEAVFPMAFEPSIMLNQAIVVLIVTGILALYPLLTIMRLDPVKAMRV